MALKDEYDKKKVFLYRHCLRGFCLFLISYCFMLFIFIPLCVSFIYNLFVKRVDQVESFSLLEAYIQMCDINQFIVALLISSLALSVFPSFYKLIRSCNRLSGLHGLVFGFISAIMVYFSKDIRAALTYPVFLAYLALSTFIVLSVYWLCTCVLTVKDANKVNKVEDKFSYKDLIDQIEEYITSGYKATENKIAVLYGKNGQGKSHSLKLLEQSITDTKDKTFDIYYFYPSRYSIESMTEEFYALIEKALTKKSFLPSLSFYSKTFASLISVIETKTRTTGFFRNFFINLLFGERKNISEVLSYYHDEISSVILFIDETDRCSLEQIDAFIALIRNLGDDIGFRIIITFTYETEQEIKEMCNSYSRESIFEKVAKKYYHLPARTLEQTKTYWNSLCVNKNKCDLLFVSEQFTHFISAILSTPRLLQIFKNHYEDFYLNYPLFRNIDNKIILFIFALKSVSPKYFSALAEAYHNARYTSRTQDFSGINSFLRESVNFEAADKKILFEKEFSYLSKTVFKTQQTYYLEYIFLNLQPYVNFTQDKVFDYKTYINQYELESNKITDQENKEALTLTVADALSQALEKNNSEVMLILNHCIENDKNNLFYLIFNKLNLEYKNIIFQALANKPNSFHFYNALWFTGSEYDLNRTSTFSESLNLHQFSQIIENFNLHDKWYGIKNLLSYSKKDKSLYDDILKKYSNEKKYLYNLCIFLSTPLTLPSGISTSDLSSSYEKLTLFFSDSHKCSNDSKEIIKTLAIVFAQSYSEIHDTFRHGVITEDFYNANINKSPMFNYFLVHIISYFYESMIRLEVGVTSISEYYATLFKKIELNDTKDAWCEETLTTYKKLHKTPKPRSNKCPSQQI